MGDSIKFKKGDSSKLPHLETGEPAFTTDEERLYIGGMTANVPAAMKKEFDAHLADYAHIVNVLTEGIKGDGTNETTAVQAALDKATSTHGVFYVPIGLTVYVDALTISSKSNFKMVVDGVLKRIASGTSARLLEITSCTDFDIETYNADGNIANNNGTVNEQQHLLSIVSSSNFHIGHINGKYPGGDVLYLSSCTEFQIDNIYGYAVDTGRNCLSIVNAKNGQFGKIISIGIGHYTMPGGVDSEPNLATDVVRNIQFGSVYVESRGTGAFSLSNHVGADCSNVIVDNLIVLKRTKTAGGVTPTGLWITNFNNVKIKGILTEDQAVSASLNTLGLYTDGGSDIDLDLCIYNVVAGANIGVFTATNKLTLSGSIYNIATYGIYIVKLTNAIIKSSIKECGMRGAGYWYAYFEYASTTTANVYFQNAGFIKGSYGDAAVRFAGKLTNVYFENCDFTGWAGYTDRIIHQGEFPANGSVIHRIGCKNFNYSSAMPTAGYWQAGEYVENTTPTVLGTDASKYVVKGWKRITSNANNVLNTDWVEDRALTGT